MTSWQLIFAVLGAAFLIALPLACLAFYIDRWRREEKMLRMMRPRDISNCCDPVAAQIRSASVECAED